MTDPDSAGWQAKFADFMKGCCDQESGYGTSMLRDMHKKMATSYKAFLEKQAAERTWETQEQQWAQQMTKMFLESLRLQRAAREKFFKSQQSMLDRYLEFLERSEHVDDEQGQNGNGAPEA